jgi:hypothetical protein
MVNSGFLSYIFGSPSILPSSKIHISALKKYSPNSTFDFSKYSGVSMCACLPKSE